jgi:hypothetical protein
LQHLSEIGGKNMAGKILTISLTDEQRQQIHAATGKNTSELNIDISATGSLSEADLDKVAGGAVFPYYKKLGELPGGRAAMYRVGLAVRLLKTAGQGSFHRSASPTRVKAEKTR